MGEEQTGRGEEFGSTSNNSAPAHLGRGKGNFQRLPLKPEHPLNPLDFGGLGFRV